MLSNTLTLDEEEAVQTELLELEAQHVGASNFFIQPQQLILEFSLKLNCLNCLKCHHQNQLAKHQSVTRSPSLMQQGPRYLWRHELVLHMLSYTDMSYTDKMHPFHCNKEDLYYHPEKSPKPVLRFFLCSSAAPLLATVTCGRLRFKYFPTPPLSAAIAVSDPTLTPNQFISSFSFFSEEVSLFPSLD